MSTRSICVERRYVPGCQSGAVIWGCGLSSWCCPLLPVWPWSVVSCWSCRLGAVRIAVRWRRIPRRRHLSQRLCVDGPGGCHVDLLSGCPLLLPEGFLRM